ncbi:hypothetical protein BD560DRAFT_77066 [Blakeslea trispora]|nr:hypothetical protein BD560DRAFT_77066 [Blakeslea trispora]
MFSKKGSFLSLLQFASYSTKPPLHRFQSAISKGSLKLAKLAYAKLDPKKQLDRPQLHKLLMLARHGKRPDDLEFMDRVIRDMRQIKMKPSHFEYHALMYAYGLHHQPEQSYAILHRMQREGLSPNLYTYNTLLACFKRTNDRSRAESIWQEMQQAHILPDTVSYNTMLHLLSQTGQFQAGFDLYEQMIDDQVHLDLHTYSTLLDMIVISESHQALGQSVYTKLLTLDRLDLHTVHSMIRFAATFDIRQAIDLYHRLPIDYPYLRPDVVTCNIMLDLCLKSGHYSKAYMIFRDSKVTPDIITYGTLIDAEIRQNNAQSALQLFHEMHASLEPTERIMNILMNIASIPQITVDQLDTLIELAEKYASQLDKKSYHALMHGLALKGRSEQVQRLYDTVFVTQLQPDIVTLTHLVLSYIHNDQLDDAMAIYRTLKEHHQRCQQGASVKLFIQLDATFYSTLIAALANPKHSKALAAAITLFNDMRPFQIQPSIYTYTAMLHACGQHRDASMLAQVHQLIKVDLFLDPDIGIYNALMDAYNRIGDGETVLEIWHTLTLPGTAQVEPDATSVSIVLDSCGHNGLVHKAPMIWSQLKRRGFQLNTNNYNSYIECLCRAQGRHGWDAAYRLVKQEMALPSSSSLDSKARIDKKTVNTLVSFAKKKMFDANELASLAQWQSLLFSSCK